MKAIVLLRHGHYDGIMALTDTGREQTRLAALWIKHTFPGKRAVISGTEPHLVESAKIVGDVLATQDGRFKELDAPGRRAKDVRSIAHIVDSWSPECNVLVLVTSLPVVRDFGHYYILGRFRQRTIQEKELEVVPGEAIVLDPETATYLKVRPYTLHR